MGLSVSIRVYEQIGSGTAPEQLVEDRLIDTLSEKPLNATRAKKILRQAYPAVWPTRVGVVPTERGWCASESARPTEKCSYHYVWRKYYVSSAEHPLTPVPPL
jgi:hypothetical protein